MPQATTEFTGARGDATRRRRDRLRGAAALLLPVLASAQTNPSFEQVDAAGSPVGWELPETGGVVLDTTLAAAGTRSLRFEHAMPDSRSRVTQRLAAPALPGNRLRLRARVRSEDFAGDAGLWMRIDAADGMLYVDGSGGRRGLGDASEWALVELEAPRFEEATVLTIGASVEGRGTVWFDDFALDAASTPPQDPSPRVQAFLDEAMDVLERHAWRRQAVAWDRLRAEVSAQAAGATRTEDAYLALRYALGRLGDRHSYFMTPRQVTSLDAAPVSNARTRRPPRAPHGERLAEGVSYLWLPGFAGGSHAAQVEFAERVQSLIEALDGEARCGWVLDLRDNQGGNLWPMLVGVGPLLGDGEAGAAVYPDGREQSYWYRAGRAGLGDFVQLRVPDPYEPLHPPRRIALLLGAETASSAESLALAFAGNPRVRSFGAATRGLATATRNFGLSDGSALVLAVAASRGTRGTMVAGPVLPDQAVDSESGGLPLAGQPIVRVALGWLTADACTDAIGVSSNGS
jgi:carboxyl-terminal processing protease